MLFRPLWATDWKCPNSSATLVALGYSIDKIRESYINSGAEMFQKARLWERFRAKFKDDRLAYMLRDLIGADTIPRSGPQSSKHC